MKLRKKIFLYILIIAVMLLAGIFVYSAKRKLLAILQPLFLALIIAYLLNPLVKRFENKKISRRVSILLIYAASLLLITAIVIFIMPEMVSNTNELINTLPEITGKYQNLFNRIISLIKSSNWPVEVKDAIFNEINNGTAVIEKIALKYLRNSLSSLLETVTMFLDFILAMIIAYYFIKDVEFFKASSLSLTPRKWRNSIIGTGREINLVLSNFIQGQLLTAFIVGVMETIGLLILKVNYPIILGIAGGISNVIPYFGPFIGAIPAVAIALIQSPAKAIWTIILFIIIQQIDNAFISPKIIEGRLGLHPVTTILAVLVGGQFFGIIGMLISVPATAIVKIIIKRVVASIV